MTCRLRLIIGLFVGAQAFTPARLPALGFGLLQRRLCNRRPNAAMGTSGGDISGSGADDDARVMVVVNGLPGAMGREVASVCLSRGLVLASVALTGAEFGGTTAEVGGRSVLLFDGSDPAAADEAAVRARAAAEEAGCDQVVCVDFTNPSAVAGNAAWYAKHGFNFVFGTTGGMRGGLTEDALRHAGCFAVVAPNMAKQIVAAGLERAAVDFPGAFSGYSLRCVESHQATKADASGTAKALMRALAALNDDPALQQSTNAGSEDAVGRALEARIVKLRDGPASRALGVPEASLRGHAFHTYTLTSADGTVEFELQHNVQGRRIYAEGAADAVSFIAGVGRSARGPLAAQGERAQHLFSMVDVLRAGAMK